jgi:hypothetical protein
MAESQPVLHPIDLEIQQPLHGQVVVGTGTATVANVSLQGRIVATTFGNPAGLLRKWYSSLGKDVLGTSDQLVAPLAVGSHTITYTVKDKNEDGVPPAQLEALFKSVEHIGATGGPPDPPPADGRPPCVVHVLIANIVAPLNGANLGLNNAVLEAEAPLQWGKYVAGAAVYPERDSAYAAVNKVRYRWFFTGINPPGARIELDVQGGNAMVLVPPASNGEVPRLRYSGGLPAGVVVGQQYVVTLRVEHAANAAQGHEVTRTVMIV